MKGVFRKIVSGPTTHQDVFGGLQRILVREEVDGNDSQQDYKEGAKCYLRRAQTSNGNQLSNIKTSYSYRGHKLWRQHRTKKRVLHASEP